MKSRDILAVLQGFAEGVNLSACLPNHVRQHATQHAKGLGPNHRAENSGIATGNAATTLIVDISDTRSGRSRETSYKL